MRCDFALSVLLFVIVSFHSPAQALPGMRTPCAGQIHQAAVDEWKNLVQTVSIVGTENRYTYPESGYTEEQIKQRFSGTGEFTCGGGVGAANLVLRNGLIALDSHALFKVDFSNHECIRPLTSDELKECYFSVIDSKGNVLPYRYHINPSTIKMGGKNAAHPKRGGAYCDDTKIIGNDWAVVELVEPVPKQLATAYELFDPSVVKDGMGQYAIDNLKITTVAAGAENFKKGPVPTICDGIVGYVGFRTDSFGDRYPTQTNSCSGGKGTSGAGVTVQQGDHVAALFGITTWTKHSSFDGVEYGNKNFSAGTVIDGAFRQAILDCQLRCPHTD